MLCAQAWKPGSQHAGEKRGVAHFHFSLSRIGEGNGNPLKYSCLAKLHSRLDSLLVTQWTPRHTRHDSRGERSLFLPLEVRPDSSGESDMRTGDPFPCVCRFAFALSLPGGFYHSTASVKSILILSPSISSILFSVMTILIAYSISPAACGSLCYCM